MTVVGIEDKIIGQKLKQRRTRLGVSQDRLGKFEGISFQQIQKYETGKNRISASRLWKFARILHVEVGYFFEGMEKESNNIKMNEFTKPNKNLESDLKKLNVSFLKICNKKLRKSVITIARELAGINKNE